MKFIGKETQRNIDLQIQTLQERIVSLENQYNISKNEMLSATKTWQTEKLELVQSNADQLEFLLLKANTEKLVALQSAETDSNYQIAKLQLQIDALQTDVFNSQQSLENEITQNTSLNLQLKEANTILAQCQSQLEAASNNITFINGKLTEEKARQNTQSKELDSFHSELAIANQKLEAASFENANNLKGLLVANEQVDRLKSANSEAEQKIKSLFALLADKNKELDLANKTLAELKVQLDSQASELSLNKITASQLGKDLSLCSLAKVDAENTIQSLKAELDHQAKIAQQTEAKYEDSNQENEFLLLQLMQAQNELVECYEQKGEFEKLYLVYKARWNRLESRAPNYLYFDSIEIEQVDGLSDVPSITWKVKDFVQSGLAMSEFSFQTTLQAGQPGIGLIQSGVSQTFVPKLLESDKAHLATFMGMGSKAFRQVHAAISILNQLEAREWKGFEAPVQFEVDFWRPSLKALIAQVQSLPIMLRYEQVKLKRELLNADYEHLWLEFIDLNLGAQHWKKFEIRLGAAFIQPEGFSQYPKFEIPLIDGRIKPFDSWYAESNDESGAKFELRFALNKKIFDVAVLAKLTEADRTFLLELIRAFPEALKRLELQKVAIHRPWKAWVQFAMSSVQVLESSKSALAKSTASVNKKEPMLTTPIIANPIVESLKPSKIDATQLQVVRESKAGKVFNVSMKPSAARKAKKAKS